MTPLSLIIPLFLPWFICSFAPLRILGFNYVFSFFFPLIPEYMVHEGKDFFFKFIYF